MKSKIKSIGRIVEKEVQIMGTLKYKTEKTFLVRQK